MRDLSLWSLTPDHSDNFSKVQWMSHLLLGVDLFAIDENSKRARAASSHSNGDMEFTFDFILEAHGLSFKVTSKKQRLISTAMPIAIHYFELCTCSPSQS